MKARKIPLQEILSLISSFGFEVQGKEKNVFITGARPVSEANAGSLCWIAVNKQNKKELAESCKGAVIVCDPSFEVGASTLRSKTLLRVKDPKHVFSHIVNHLFVHKPAPGIHPTAFIHPEANIAKDVHIGPHTYVGRSEIGTGTVLLGTTHIHDNVVIGKNVTIHAGCVIGDVGNGEARDEKGEYYIFPHIGGVLIEDGVTVGANTYVNRGALGNTWIKRGAKIGNSVCIGHNVVIGHRTMVLANSLVGGSTVVGDDSLIYTTVTIRDAITVGSRVTLAMGSVVTRSVPDGETWAGSPAKPIEEFKKLQDKLRKI